MRCWIASAFRCGAAPSEQRPGLGQQRSDGDVRRPRRRRARRRRQAPRQRPRNLRHGRHRSANCATSVLVSFMPGWGCAGAARPFQARGSRPSAVVRARARTRVGHRGVVRDESRRRHVRAIGTGSDEHRISARRGDARVDYWPTRDQRDPPAASRVASTCAATRFIDQRGPPLVPTPRSRSRCSTPDVGPDRARSTSPSRTASASGRKSGSSRPKHT